MEKVTGSDTTEQLSLSESSLGNKKGHEVTHWSHPSMINRFSHVRLFVTLWDNPGSSVHAILQARILDWVAMSSSRGSSQIRDQI